MKITIEIEDSVYNTLCGFCPPGIPVELIVERLLTQVVALMATTPNAAIAIFEKSSEVPEYRHMLEQLGKPPPQEK